MTVLLVLATAAVFYAVLTLPQWFATSMNRGALWALRDHVYDARRVGDLPRDPAVAARIEMIEAAIDVLPTLTPTRIPRVARSAPLIADPSPDWMTAGETEMRLVLVDSEFVRILSRHLVTGSWPGVAIGLFSRNGRSLLSLVATRRRFERPGGLAREPVPYVPAVKEWRDGLSIGSPGRQQRQLAV